MQQPHSGKKFKFRRFPIPYKPHTMALEESKNVVNDINRNVKPIGPLHRVDAAAALQQPL